MSKKEAYFADAERLYVVEQFSLQRIASELMLNFKTVLSWKQEGGWEEKRLEFLKSKQMFHEEMYKFARKLMHSIEVDIDNGEKTDSAKMYTFLRMLPSITRVRDYEDAQNKAKDNEADRERKTLTDDELRQIEELLGIRSHDDEDLDDEENK